MSWMVAATATIQPVERGPSHASQEHPTFFLGKHCQTMAAASALTERWGASDFGLHSRHAA